MLLHIYWLTPIFIVADSQLLSKHAVGLLFFSRIPFPMPRIQPVVRDSQCDAFLAIGQFLWTRTTSVMVWASVFGRFFYKEGGEALKQLVLRSGGCPWKHSRALNNLYHGQYPCLLQGGWTRWQGVFQAKLFCDSISTFSFMPMFSSELYQWWVCIPQCFHNPVFLTPTHTCTN